VRIHAGEEREIVMREINKHDLDNYITGHYGEDQLRDDDEMEDEDECFSVCTRCNGTGISIRGMDCEYCDGDGRIEI
jgi:hypothetical protein